MKLFISQPMKNLPDHLILAERANAIVRATKYIEDCYGAGTPVEVIDSYFATAPADAKPLWYIAESINKLSQADVAFFNLGWEDARGCRIENQCAHAYETPLIIEEHTGMAVQTYNTKDRCVRTSVMYKE